MYSIPWLNPITYKNKRVKREAAVLIKKGKVKEPECRNEHEDSLFLTFV